jgi:colicin import membrane protein
MNMPLELKSSDQQLVTIDPSNALTLFSAPGGFDPILAAVREKIDAFVCPSMDTKKGRDELRKFANDIAKTKVYLDDAGKILVRDMKEIPGKVDATRRRMRDTLDQWKEETRAPLTEWEEAEDARIKGHRDMIGMLNSFVGAPLTGSREAIINRIGDVEAILIGPVCEEFEAEYARAKDAALRALRGALADRERYDAEQAELARLRAAEAEREAVRKKEAEAAAAVERERQRKEREATIAAEATERARLKAESDAQKERERREHEARAAERAAQQEREVADRRAQAERDEYDRVTRQIKAEAEAAERRAADREARIRRDADESISAAERRAKEQAAAEKAEAERRETNKKHAAAVNRKARDALISGGMVEEAATLAVTLIASRKIPAISIAY